VPATSYTQDEVLALLGVEAPKLRRFFRNSHIERRHLVLPPLAEGRAPVETPQELIDKHRTQAIALGSAAIQAALAPTGLALRDIDFLVCVTSTGFLCPGLSAHLTAALGLRDDVHRMDVVGMGCNAAMNALRAATGLAAARPASVGIQLCVEVCSAAYAVNDTPVTSVVNSLFGDGAAAIVLSTDAEGDDDGRPAPTVVDFESYILRDAIAAMRFDLEGDRLSFHLDRDIPWVIGQHVDRPVGRLLARHGLSLGDVSHWVLHSGGKKVIDAIAVALGLSDQAVRHTRDILRTQGNVSSAAVLFALERTMAEDEIAPGDVGVMIAMGPGTSIEAALLRW
jgi:polyketide synthase Type III